jgi:hypothetical protein
MIVEEHFRISGVLFYFSPRSKGKSNYRQRPNFSEKQEPKQWLNSPPYFQKADLSGRVWGGSF